MLMHVDVELFQVNLGEVSLEKVEKAVDHIRPDCQNTYSYLIGTRSGKMLCNFLLWSPHRSL
jgi:hypothetical protein